MTLIIQGKSISPGLAAGITFLHRDIVHCLDAPTDIEKDTIEQGFEYLEDATAKITLDLLTLATRVEMELSLCGELAGRAQYTEKLLHCGIRKFSVAPPLIPAIKENIHDRHSEMPKNEEEK